MGYFKDKVEVEATLQELENIVFDPSLGFNNIGNVDKIFSLENKFRVSKISGETLLLSNDETEDLQLRETFQKRLYHVRRKYLLWKVQRYFTNFEDFSDDDALAFQQVVCGVDKFVDCSLEVYGLQDLSDEEKSMLTGLKRKVEQLIPNKLLKMADAMMSNVEYWFERQRDIGDVSQRVLRFLPSFSLDSIDRVFDLQLLSKNRWSGFLDFQEPEYQEKLLSFKKTLEDYKRINNLSDRRK